MEASGKKKQPNRQVNQVLPCMSQGRDRQETHIPMIMRLPSLYMGHFCGWQLDKQFSHVAFFHSSCNPSDARCGGYFFSFVDLFFLPLLIQPNNFWPPTAKHAKIFSSLFFRQATLAGTGRHFRSRSTDEAHPGK